MEIAKKNNYDGNGTKVSVQHSVKLNQLNFQLKIIIIIISWYTSTTGSFVDTLL